MHTFGMRFDIDVAFLDGDGRVVHLVRGLRPGRLTRWSLRGRTVVEMPAGALEASCTGKGDLVTIDPEG